MADGPDSRLWSTMVALGVGVGVALGAILVLIFRRQPMQAQLAAPRLYELPEPEAAFPSIAPTLPHYSAARSISVGTTQSRVFKANGPKPWHIQVRTVSPPGATAFFSTSDNPGEAISVVAGDFQNMWLGPGQDLYASATQDGVTISASGGAA